MALGRTYLLPPLSSGGALMVPPWLRFHIPLIGRVEDWRAGRPPTVPRFQSPPRRTQRADFPHCAPPFASRQRLWDLSCWGDFRPVASHSIGVEQPSSVVQPPPIPSFPAEALSFLSKSPEPPGRFSLRLDVYSPPQVLQINGRLCHLVLAFPYVGDIANGRAPSLRGHYSASSLLRTQPPPSRLRPTSRFRRLYGLPCSDDFAPGRGGLLQLLGMSLSPCCRFHPAEVNIRIGQSSAAHAAFALRLKARPSGILIFEATTRSLLLRPGDL